MWKDRFSGPVQALLAEDEWLVAEEGYHPRDQIVYESIFCLASGYMGSRASAEEGFCRRTMCTGCLTVPRHSSGSWPIRRTGAS